MSNTTTIKQLMKKHLFYCFIILFIIHGCNNSEDRENPNKSSLSLSFAEGITRHWISPDFWGNRMQDWQVHDGRLECLRTQDRLKTVQLLTRELDTIGDQFHVQVQTGIIHPDKTYSEKAFTGFLIGAGGLSLDYRARAFLHKCSGANGGFVAALTPMGKLTFLSNEDALKEFPGIKPGKIEDPSILTKGIILDLRWQKKEESVLILSAIDINEKDTLARAELQGIPTEKLIGNIAMAVNYGPEDIDDPWGKSFWFDNFLLEGNKVKAYPDRAFGPVINAMYTLHHHDTLTLNAQLPALGSQDNDQVTLETRESGESDWQTIKTTTIDSIGWNAIFRLTNWNHKKDHQYRIKYTCKVEGNETDTFYYEGLIPKEPVDKQKLRVAGISCNNNFTTFRGEQLDFTIENIWFPHNDILEGLKAQSPDMMVHLGDQFYEINPTPPDDSGDFSSYVDYIYKWAQWCWTYGELTRIIPTVAIPDDHDVFQINLWGAKGKDTRDPLKAGDPNKPPLYEEKWWFYELDGGGYKLPPSWVNMVQHTQTGNLPPPFDPRPVKRGIKVYYTDLNYGGISFAILEDRKFKSAPGPLLPEAKIKNGYPQNPDFNVCTEGNIPEADLLGDRQLYFLNHWANDWKNTSMKAVLSQTIPACLSTSGPGDREKELEELDQGDIATDHQMNEDMDANGWPQHGRDSALMAIRKGFGFMIAGDQHLSSLVHHGVDEWEDAGYSFCVPATSNIAPRRWFPAYKGKNHQSGKPPYTGRYKDGFCNKISVKAVGNPYDSPYEPSILHDRATGYGMIIFDKKEKTITTEVWPRFAIDHLNDSLQFLGWPNTISMYENYGKKPAAYLPLVNTVGLNKPPVVQVINENQGQVIYTVRAKENSFQAWVFSDGKHTIKIGEPGRKMKTLTGLDAKQTKDQKPVELNFNLEDQ